jgi:hypothetical protein
MEAERNPRGGGGVRPSLRVLAVVGVSVLLSGCLGTTRTAAPVIVAPTPEIVAPTPTPEPERCDVQLVRSPQWALLQEFQDAVTLARATSRIALGPQVATLQRVRREAAADTWPECASHLKQTTLGAMDKTIAGYLAFLRGNNPYAGTPEMILASSAWGAWSAELTQLSGLQPTD